MHLDRNRSLEIVLSSGWNEVISGELQVRGATAGLRLQTSEAKVATGSLEISKKSEAGMVKFGAMANHSEVKLTMPFTLEHEVNDLCLKLEISYTTDQGAFFFAKMPSVSIVLPLGVNVQDVFKHKVLFSKFSIATATSSPLRLLSSRLDGSDAFKAEGGMPMLKPLTIYPRQPASMLYKITKTGKFPVPARNSKSVKSSLSLVLNYICLEEEIENSLSANLRQVLESHPLHPYIRLIVPTVVTELLKHMSPYDLERTAVLSEVSTSYLASTRWRDHFAGLGQSPKDQSQDMAVVLEEFLHTWQRSVLNIPLIQIRVDDPAIGNIRSISIPVDVPSVTVVHTADLKILESNSVPSSTKVVPLNQPIPTSLVIKWTRTWDHGFVVDADKETGREDLEFYYEVSGSSDIWLIGGKRKGHFKIPKDVESIDGKNKLKLPVVLIPLREGYLPYPSVEIKAVAAPKTVGDDGVVKSTTTVSCETDFRNAGETVRVISDARRTTVSLDASGPNGGAWLLESERRGMGRGGGAVPT